MDDGFDFGAGMVLGFVTAAVVALMIGFAIWGDDATSTFQTACDSILGAEYVQELNACVEGDEIVHRFEKEDGL